ncbi:hypothetical protein [Phenylobacterium aquaticum]|uniref:hypothetical protein n=1 Tax=Phenylobacterium aquaticum TaxID=1763816 RepID=UPI0023513655|nr:hypothetical protein [Phenylobacterium aquaticum]
MHRLVGQGAEFRTQGRDHPAGQVEVLPIGGAEVLLDRDHLLLADEAVPAAQGLGVLRGVGVIGRHVLAHDVGGVAGDFQAGLEAVLETHPGHGLGVDAVPGAVLARDELAHLNDVVLIGHVPLPRSAGGKQEGPDLGRPRTPPLPQCERASEV